MEEKPRRHGHGQLRCGKRHGGGRQHGRVGVVLVADNMGEWEEASGSLGFWDWAWMLG
ncbi:hypothetical protein ES319_A11G178700v1 [Gossypium barbadense]|uniref:Uncharacterized protein n=2 Tax=Gossypium TaxID=3633 RepID=A0A5J5TS30_GOSBA|nr:hypothetical protein ES319_1Z081800v1 [Gossypium barbadense]KAB2057591.1 hypothetical protein ES319_A11G178700v1 [Gossypium barbadense]TYG36261.1 hypothetical protein ES288_D13G050700v1 [Gossypium darwinii]TYG62767.1 hypothetical protein ES288_D07G258400v1 [Gossypium darwinii]